MWSDHIWRGHQVVGDHLNMAGAFMHNFGSWAENIFQHHPKVMVTSNLHGWLGLHCSAQHYSSNNVIFWLGGSFVILHEWLIGEIVGKLCLNQMFVWVYGGWGWGKWKFWTLPKSTAISSLPLWKQRCILSDKFMLPFPVLKLFI